MSEVSLIEDLGLHYIPNVYPLLSHDMQILLTKFQTNNHNLAFSEVTIGNY